MSLRAATIGLLALIAGSNAAAAQQLECTGTQKSWMVAELLFAREHVSEARWSQFLASEVTPRFPDGLTVYDAKGQWRAPGSKKISRERSKVVMIAMPPGTDNDTYTQAPYLRTPNEGG